MKKILILIITVILTVSCSKIHSAKNGNGDLPLNEEMVLIPAGEVIIGTDDEKNTDYANYIKTISVQIAPFNLRRVFVDAFYISKYETTNLQFNEFLLDDGYNKKEYWSEDGWDFIKMNHIKVPQYWGEKIPNVYSTLDHPDYPALGTSWYEASAYAKWRNMRLPTEIEWEKAARGSKGNVWPWGNSFSNYLCNTVESKIGGTLMVDAYKNGVSPYGIMNMCGNVYEFTSDLYEELEQNSAKLGVNWSEGAAILRGGSWDDSGDANKTWRRFIASVHERERGRHNGIRLAKDAFEDKK